MAELILWIISMKTIGRLRGPYRDITRSSHVISIRAPQGDNSGSWSELETVLPFSGKVAYMIRIWETLRSFLQIMELCLRRGGLGKGKVRGTARRLEAVTMEENTLNMMSPGMTMEVSRKEWFH
ncbi:hypothetical protein BaRGS_00006418 [Batillaria attramentaria]|uniref:Uncharacterized protein n=1 Tax=Batillaria attramentaria TaxID=370345 RepID=A0ABD0LSE2_9CAEN